MRADRESMDATDDITTVYVTLDQRGRVMGTFATEHGARRDALAKAMNGWGFMPRVEPRNYDEKDA